MAERIIFRVGRYSSGRTKFDELCAFSNEINDPSDLMWANVKAPQDLFVFVQDVLSQEPDKIIFLGPSMKNVRAWILARNIGISETRNTCDQHAGVDYGACLASLSALRQR